ncbi:MAG: metallopeptidase TldD-related protein [Pseudomonadota bacterium]
MRQRWPRLCVLALALSAMAPISAQITNRSDPDADPLIQAMADELERSIKELKLADESPPYYVEYRLQDSYLLAVKATLGSIASDNQSHNRSGHVQVRVGTYDLDSSLVSRFGMRGSSLHRYYNPNNFRLPVDDNYAALRRSFWLATDLAYKRALEDYSVKLADKQAMVDRDELVDFYAAPVVAIEELSPRPAIELAEARSLATELSQVLAEFPELHESNVWLRVYYRDIRYLNAEGSRFHRQVPDITIGAIARTQADDGAVLWDFEHFRARQLSDLPDKARLKDQLRAMGARLTEARSAVRLDQYVGPVLFQGQAAAALFAEVFASQLQSVPRMVASEPAMQPYIADLQARHQRFGRKIGSRVLPRGATLVDDPTLDAFETLPLIGRFRVDDEGVAASRKVLVEEGRLKQILSSRIPMYGTSASTGNSRGGFPMPGNLILTSNVAANANERSQLLEELRIDAGTDYVIVVEKLGDPQAQRQLESMQSMAVFNYGERLPEALVAWRQFPDGRRERVRNLNIERFAVREFRRLEAIGDDYYVHSVTPRFPSGGYFLAGVRGALEPASFVVPSLLFEELAIADGKTMDRRPPVLPRPPSP